MDRPPKGGIKTTLPTGLIITKVGKDGLCGQARYVDFPEGLSNVLDIDEIVFILNEKIKGMPYDDAKSHVSKLTKYCLKGIWEADNDVEEYEPIPEIILPVRYKTGEAEQ